MNEYIDKEKALNLLKLSENLARSKRFFSQANGILRAMEEIRKMPPVGAEEMHAPTPTTNMYDQVEPWFKDGKTGRTVFRCGHCAQCVDKRDLYCRACGCRLLKKEEKKDA